MLCGPCLQIIGYVLNSMGVSEIVDRLWALQFTQFN
jgi:hypothetical protein